MKHKGKISGLLLGNTVAVTEWIALTGCNYKTGFTIILYRLYYLYIANDTQLLFWTLV